MPDKISVHEAIALVVRDLPGIEKGDRSPQGYTYRGIEAITKQLQPLLALHGVVIVPQASIAEIRPAPDMGPKWQDVYMTVTWMIYGPDGSSVTAMTTGIGRDNADKGANKAQTQAYKYLLLHLLCIADTEDDADGKEYHDDEPSGTTYGGGDGPSLEQQVAMMISGLSGAAKKAANDYAKEQGVKNVMRSGDKAQLLLDYLSASAPQAAPAEAATEEPEEPF